MRLVNCRGRQCPGAAMTTELPMLPARPGSDPGTMPRRAGRFGISVKLQVAFGVVAGLTVIAAAVALLSFETVESGLQDVTARQVPVTVGAMQLANISGDISAAAARFISAKTADDRKSTLALIGRKRAELAAAMSRVEKTNSSSPAFGKFVSLAQRLDANLTDLKEAISGRTA